MTKAEEKQRLRAVMRQLERELPERYKQNADRAIAAHLLAMPEYQESDTVFCFVGTAREINTRPVLVDTLAAGKRLCVPLCTGKGLMELRQIQGLDELSLGAYSILEPAMDSPAVSLDDVDFAVLPCLTCNHQGQRLGQGGGYYDRFLSSYRGGAILLCREKLIREEIPVEPHDHPVPWVLTETCLYEDGTPARFG